MHHVLISPAVRRPCSTEAAWPGAHTGPGQVTGVRRTVTSSTGSVCGGEQTVIHYSYTADSLK